MDRLSAVDLTSRLDKDEYEERLEAAVARARGDQEMAEATLRRAVAESRASPVLTMESMMLQNCRQMWHQLSKKMA